MKRKKRSLVQQLMIDLTPLLDVIFILLIIVLADGDVTSREAKGQYQAAADLQYQAEQQIDETEQKISAYQSHYEAYDNMDAYFKIITVSAGYEPADRTKRTVRVLVNNGEEITYSLNNLNSDDKWKELEEELGGIISEMGGLPAVLVLNTRNDEKMLYRDEEKILSIFDTLRLAYANVQTGR